MKTMRKKILVKGSNRRGDKDVVATVKFLMSENTYYFTRRVIFVNGGLS